MNSAPAGGLGVASPLAALVERGVRSSSAAVAAKGNRLRGDCCRGDGGRVEVCDCGRLRRRS